MNKKLVLVLITLLGIVIGGTTVFLISRQKVAYINTALLMEKSKVIQTIKEKVKSDVSVAKSNVDTLQMDFETKMKQYEREVSSMSDKEKKLAQEVLTMKRQELIRYQQAVQEKLSQDEQKKTGEALNAINAYISEYGKKNGYQIIFATINGNIAYADESIDITEEIIKNVNENIK